MNYQILISPLAIQDIQQAIDYYDEQQLGLGEKFESALNEYLQVLKKYPLFQFRYDKVRCLPLPKFPYMIHFTVDEKEKTVIIQAIFHTAKNPKSWKKR